MPRGVAIPELREQLLQAAQRLLVRDGPSGLSSRAITAEAGVAKGVLHNHFSDLDGFLAEFVLAIFHAAFQDVTGLKAKAGQGSMQANLAKAAGALLDSQVHAAHGILLSRPSLAARLHGGGRGHRPPDLADLEQIFTAYLDAEKALGRVMADADTKALSLALVASVHHVLMTRNADMAGARKALKRVLDVLLRAATPRGATGAQE